MNQKTSYTINIKTEKLIDDAIAQINKLEFSSPKIMTSRAKMVITKYRITVIDVHPNGKQASILLETADSNGRKFENNREEIEIAKDFVVDTVQNMKVPATSISEFIADGLCDKLADLVYDALKKNK